MIIAEDGVVVDLVGGRASIVGAVPCGYVYVDGVSVGDITDASLKDRRILGEEGFISVFVAVDITTGTVVAGPEIHGRGFAEDGTVFDEVLPQVRSAVEQALLAGRGRCRAAATDRPPGGRPLGSERPPAAPDDRPGDRGGVVTCVLA